MRAMLISFDDIVIVGIPMSFEVNLALAFDATYFNGGIVLELVLRRDED
jgi:hypothetical protein